VIKFYQKVKKAVIAKESGLTGPQASPLISAEAARDRSDPSADRAAISFINRETTQ
jgi:hypothetical protein